jgi:hypothetical protein
MSNQSPNLTGQSTNNINTNNLNQQQILANSNSSRTAANTPNNYINNNSNSVSVLNNSGLVNKHLTAVTGSHPTANKSNINIKKNDQTQSDSSNSFIRQVSIFL